MPVETTCEYTKVRDKKKLTSVFNIKEYRKINKDHTFSYKGGDYSIVSKLKNSLVNYRVEIRTNLNGEVGFYFADKILNVSENKRSKVVTFRETEAKEIVKAVRLSKELNSVSKASQITKISRQKIYRVKKVIETRGEFYFIKTFKAEFYSKNKKMMTGEKLVVNFSIQNPHLGEAQVSKFIKKYFSLNLSRGKIRYIWVRNNLETIALRTREKDGPTKGSLKAA